MEEPKEPPEKLLELSPRVRKFLAGLRDNEVDALKVIVEQKPEDINNWFKLARDVRTIGRFGYWLAVTIISIFLGTVVLYEQVLKVIGFFRGGPAS